MLKEKVEGHFREDEEIRDKFRTYASLHPYALLNKRIDRMRNILREIVDWAEKIEDLKILQKER